MRRVVSLAATLAVAIATLLSSTAHASKFIQPGIFDDAQILFGNPDKVFPTLAQMNTKLIRANLWWGGPGLTVAKRRPQNPANPNDPAYDWATYDRTVTDASKFGIKVVFAIIGTPGWANKNKGWNSAPTNVNDLRSFATAAARRYSGLFAGPDGALLPRVPYWLAWNEPNNPVFLKPQYAKVKSEWQIVSGRTYAKMCNAIVIGVHTVSKGLKVGCGVTAPRGNNNPNSSRPSVSPLPFLRSMSAGGAKGFDAYAHHPYYGASNETPSSPPTPPSRGQPATAVTLGNLSVLTKELARLKYNVRIWVTEYGYQTNPPDKLIGVSWANQARYLTQAYALLQANPRVDMFIWFLLRDEIRVDGWQSGLLTASGARKDAREAFEHLAAKK